MTSTSWTQFLLSFFDVFPATASSTNSSSPSSNDDYDPNDFANLSSKRQRKPIDPSSRPPYDHFSQGRMTSIDIMLGPNMMIQTIPTGFSAGQTKSRRVSIPLEFRQSATNLPRKKHHRHHRRQSTSSANSESSQASSSSSVESNGSDIARFMDTAPGDD